MLTFLNPRVPNWLLSDPIAHRGLHSSDSPPENSLAAFELAMKARIPIELDVQITADGSIVVFHDADLFRMTGSHGIVSHLKQHDLVKLTLLNTKMTIPTLHDALDLIRGSVPLLIELKTMRIRVGALEDSVVQTLHGYVGEFALQSFNPLSVGWIRRHAPGICCGQLSAGHIGIPLRMINRPDFVAYDLRSLPQASVTRARKLGMPVLAWTIRSEADAQLAETRADNYIFEPATGFRVSDY